VQPLAHRLSRCSLDGPRRRRGDGTGAGRARGGLGVAAAAARAPHSEGVDSGGAWARLGWRDGAALDAIRGGRADLDSGLLAWFGRGGLGGGRFV
jgi:hypothetical protein